MYKSFSTKPASACSHHSCEVQLVRVVKQSQAILTLSDSVHHTSPIAVATRYVVLLTGNLNNLRSAAYEALMELIKNSPKDCYEVVKRTTEIILERLQTILQMEVVYPLHCWFCYYDGDHGFTFL